MRRLPVLTAELASMELTSLCSSRTATDLLALGSSAFCWLTALFFTIRLRFVQIRAVSGGFAGDDP